MKFFVVYWHPEPKSFNHAMYESACTAIELAGHELQTSDLHSMNFDPISSRKNFKTTRDPDYLSLPLEEAHATIENGFSDEIEAEIQKMEWCDIMIWQFPLWWLGMPAMMKGWVDRVFARRRTYGHSDYHSEGVFSGKRAMISTTTGVAEGAYRKDGPSGDISGLLRPVHHGVLKFTGYSVLAPHVVYSPIRMTEQERCDALNSFSERVIQLPDELPIDIP